MEKISFAIHCDKYQKRKDGTSALYVRITINRKSRLLPLSKFVKAEYFDTKSKRVKEVKAVPQAKNLNRFLTAQELRVDDIILDLQRRNQAVTFESIKEHFNGKGGLNFIQYCQDTMNAQKVDLKQSTIDNATYRLQKIEKFHPDLNLYEIDQTWLLKYKQYLLEKLENSYNTYVGDFKLIKKYLTHAYRNDLISSNPFDKGFKINWVEKEKHYLTMDELQTALEFYKSRKLLKLTRKDKAGKVYQAGHRLQSILQHFLIGCFSGLRISDIRDLRREHIDLEQNYIKKKMFKGMKNQEKIVTIPLSPQLKDVLNISDSEKVYAGTVVTGSKTNNSLREILRNHIGICLDKHITFHSSRRTFGVTSLTLGMPLETVQDLMGHSEIKTTQIYAKIVDSKRHKDMSVWDSFGKSEKSGLRVA